MKKVNGITIYEENDPCALDEYSEQLEKDLTAKFDKIEGENEQESADILTLQNKVTSLEQETEEQQGQITELQNKVIVLEDQIPTGEASGNSIHIADSSNLEAKFRLNGGDKQETREGYNLLDSSLFKLAEKNGITATYNENDSSITLNGTNTSENFWAYELLLPDDKKITCDKDLYMYIFKDSGSFTDGTTSNLGLIIYDISWQNTKTLRIGSSEISKLKVSSDNVNYQRVQIQITPGSSFNNLVIKLQISKVDKDEFEQYGAMPSPNYPSKVETVGSNINLFDGEMEKGTINDTTGVNEHEDWQVVRSKNYINVKGLKNITLSLVHASNTVIFFDSLKSVISHNAITTKNIRTVELPENCEYIRFYEWVVDLNSKRKIEPGDKATAYSPYGMGSVEINVSNKQLFNIRDLVKGMGALNLDEEDFVTVTVDNSSGSSQKYYNVYTNPSKLIKPNTKYYLVLEVKEITGTGNIMVHSFNATDHKPQFSGSKNYGFANLVAGDIKIDEITSLEDFSDSNSMLRTFLSYNAGQSGSITFRISVLEEEPTAEILEYTKYEQQTKIMPIQQEMLEGDYIEDVEHHGWNKKILTGNESYGFAETSAQPFRLNLSDAEQLTTSQDIAPNVYCSHFTPVAWNSSKTELEAWITALVGKQLAFGYRDITTLEDWKAYLAEQYTAGTPVTIYYKLATPLDLELTEKQKEAQKINAYKNVTNIAVDNSLATLDVTYKKDQNTVNKNYEDRIAALEAAILS